MTRIIEDGEWITGGLWGAYEQWSLGAAAAEGRTQGRWEPSRSVIDDITADNPCLLSSFDYELFLANTPALQAAGLDNASLPGMKMDADGKLTGLIAKDSPALEKIGEKVKPKSHERLMNENRAALKRLAESGVVEVQDITGDDQMERYVELQKNGELTARIWMRPDLSRASEFKEKGIKMGTHPYGWLDNYLRWGAFKGYIDGIMGTHGALFFEPYNDQPDNYGHYRRHTSDEEPYNERNMEKMYGYLADGNEIGYVANVHAIGTKGVALMLDTYERLKNELGTDLSGYRVIHAQVIRARTSPASKSSTSLPRSIRITCRTTCAGWKNGSVTSDAKVLTRFSRCWTTVPPSCSVPIGPARAQPSITFIQSTSSTPPSTERPSSTSRRAVGFRSKGSPWKKLSRPTPSMRPGQFRG